MRNGDAGDQGVVESGYVVRKIPDDMLLALWSGYTYPPGYEIPNTGLLGGADLVGSAGLSVTGVTGVPFSPYWDVTPTNWIGLALTSGSQKTQLRYSAQNGTEVGKTCGQAL